MIRMLKNKFTAGLLAVTTLFVGTSAATSADLFEVAKNIDIFTSVYKELNTYYVDDVDPNKLMRTGIDAMLESLDPYTNYISEAEIEGYKFQITGNYGGIGASIRPINKEATVVELYPGFAAEKAGLRVGDILIEIDGKKLTADNNESISELLRGSPGTTVNVKVKRPFTDNELSFSIMREDIDVKNVPYYGFVENGIGYIILAQFTEDAGLHVANALKDLQTKDPNMQGLILDLRGNPGGLLREAVNVSNVFINKGEEICSTLGKVKEWDKTFKTLNNAVDAQIKLVVLTNSSSASASEIVAGAIQDLDRGVVVGQKSYGKGLVQTPRDISYNTKLKLTTANYYIPSGRCIQALDYSHRNPDGSVGKVPDSLKTAFQTRNGRTVYDGGGIDPDIYVEQQEYKDITASLITKNLIFQYATKYRHEHESIGDAKNFTLSDAEYNDFVKWVEGKEYTYTTDTERSLDNLEANAKDDSYFNTIKHDIDHLRETIQSDKKNDLVKYKDEIKSELEMEIASRYYNDNGRIESSFSIDLDLQEAMRIIKDETAYRAILKTQ